MRKNAIRITLVAIAMAAGAFWVVGSTRTPSKQVPCEESIEECCKKNDGADPAIWETLSSHLISFTSLN